MEKKPIPEINKEYYCYDDGKPYKSRQYKIKIVGVIPFEEANDFYKKLWNLALADHENLFDNNTDYIIETISYEMDYPEIELMARTIDGGWFGLGKYNSHEDNLDCWFCSGRLDIDNNITDQLQSYKDFK